jgi:hypothetical protein
VVAHHQELAIYNAATVGRWRGIRTAPPSISAALKESLIEATIRTSSYVSIKNNSDDYFSSAIERLLGDNTITGTYRLMGGIVLFIVVLAVLSRFVR